MAAPGLFGANGNVLGIARSGSTLYIAGSFRALGENTGSYLTLSATSGQVLRPLSKVAGEVFVIAPDDSGGWYLGGDFTSVGGQPRSCLAHIRANGSLGEWNPSITGSPSSLDLPGVTALAITRDHIYVGGYFSAIGGVPRINLACVDRQSGTVLDWSADTSLPGRVASLAVSGDTVFVGGGFGAIGGQPHTNLAAVDAVTGAVLPWDANVFGGVNALLVNRDTLYVAGDFIGIGGQPQPILAAVDVPTAQLLPFNAHVEGVHIDYVPVPQATALALAGDTLYVVGNFTQIGGESRSSIAALDATTGTALPWLPAAVGPIDAPWFPPRLCTCAALRGPTLYVGGFFELLGGVSHPFVGALDRASGAASTWNPKLEDVAYALGVKGDTVVVGGDFMTAGEWRHRAGLAAIDLSTGNLKPWNPNPNGTICTTVAACGDRVFVSGDFTTIGGVPQPRTYFAALDTTNGEVTDWNPGGNEVAHVMLPWSDTLYVGGWFTQFGGLTRSGLAAVDTKSGAVTPWNPGTTPAEVLALATAENTLYVGGMFNRLAGYLRSGIGALEPSTGLITPWAPATDNNTVYAMAASGNTVYVGGGFGQIGRLPRTGLAALDATTGLATEWDPHLERWNTPQYVQALAFVGDQLIAGGNFGRIGGQPRICLAAVDTATGLATDWDPGLDGLVWSLLADGNTFYVGGGFSRAGGLPASGLAAFTFPQPPPPPPPPTRLAIAELWPNPVHSSATLRLALPTAGAASLDVFDLQGRRVAAVLRDQPRPAGFSDVSVRTDDWRLGLYLCRLTVGGQRASRKLLVVR